MLLVAALASTPAAPAASSLPTTVPSWYALPSQLSWLGVLALVVVAIIVVGVAVNASIVTSPGRRQDHDAFFHSPTWAAFSTLLISSMVVAAIWHSIFTSAGPDATSLSFLAFALIVAVMPFVDKIAFPGSGSIDFLPAAVRETALDLEQARKSAQLGVASAANTIVQALADVAFEKQKARPGFGLFAARKLFDASDIVAQILTAAAADGQKPEPIRISALITSTGGKRLAFAIGWPDDAAKALANVGFDIDKGPLSRVFTDTQTLSFTDLPLAVRLPARTGIVYRGLLATPLWVDGSPVGVLCVERALAERFDAYQVSLVRSLAVLFALALR